MTENKWEKLDVVLARVLANAAKSHAERKPADNPGTKAALWGLRPITHKDLPR